MAQNQFYGQSITLYHYTTEEGARAIERDEQIKERPSGYGRHERHGQGVNFTSFSPYLGLSFLIKNNFVNAGQHVRNESVFYHRMRHVVEIQFYGNDRIEKITDGSRDLFVHRGDIDLKNYRGRYRIYPNPNFS